MVHYSTTACLWVPPQRVPDLHWELCLWDVSGLGLLRVGPFTCKSAGYAQPEAPQCSPCVIARGVPRRAKFQIPGSEPTSAVKCPRLAHAGPDCHFSTTTRCPTTLSVPPDVLRNYTYTSLGSTPAFYPPPPPPRVRSAPNRTFALRPPILNCRGIMSGALETLKVRSETGAAEGRRREYSKNSR
jgi:hypothetical protein